MFAMTQEDIWGQSMESRRYRCYSGAMSDVTRILSQIEQGDPSAAEELLPLVYDELRKLAAARLAHEQPGQTLQATALVHDAFIRLVDVEKTQHWDSRGHFFAAAAEAMRRIVIENARRKHREKHGGGLVRVELLEIDLPIKAADEHILLLDDVLERFAELRPQAAELVKLRFFAGLTVDQAATVIGVSSRTARRLWVFAQAWLRRAMDSEMESESSDKH